MSFSIMFFKTHIGNCLINRSPQKSYQVNAECRMQTCSHYYYYFKPESNEIQCKNNIYSVYLCCVQSCSMLLDAVYHNEFPLNNFHARAWCSRWSLLTVCSHCSIQSPTCQIDPNPFGLIWCKNFCLLEIRIKKWNAEKKQHTHKAPKERDGTREKMSSWENCGSVFDLNSSIHLTYIFVTMANVKYNISSLSMICSVFSVLFRWYKSFE